MEIGEAYAAAAAFQKQGRKAEAIATYQWIAGQFAGKGELLRAIAALQGILKIDPQHAQTQTLLAELYAKRKAQGAPTPNSPAAKPPKVVKAVEPPPPPPPAEPEPEAIPDEALEPLTDKFKAIRLPDTPSGERPAAGEPARMLQKGKGTRPPGWPEAIPARYASVPLFSSLSTRVFVAVLGEVNVHRLVPETVIVKQGDPGDSIFAIADGTVRVTKEVASGNVLELATLPAGSFFGEMALLTGGPRRATVSALTHVEVLELPRGALERLSSEAPTVAETLRRFCRERLLQTALATGVLFRDLPMAERDQLVHRFRTLDAKPGTTLLKEGFSADGLYVLVDGSAEVRKEMSPGKIATLAVLQGGDFCGEMSLLSGGIATATVVVKQHATLLKLPKEVCEEVFRARPDLLATVAKVAAHRKALNDRILSGALPKPADGTSPA